MRKIHHIQNGMPNSGHDSKGYAACRLWRNIRHFGCYMMTFLVVWAMLLSVAYADASRPIAVLLSGDESAYTVTMKAFVSEVDLPVKVYNMHGDVNNGPKTVSQILASNPALIFALGAKAAYFAKIGTTAHQNIPVIFAMVLNWQKYKLLQGQKNIAGIQANVDLGTQLANLTIFSPDIHRIGIVYSKSHSSEIVEKARNVAKKIGIELVTQPIGSPDEFRRAYKNMVDRIDAFLILADPVVYTLENIPWLEKRCVSDRLICIGQSKNIARLGVLLAVNPDDNTIGSQAASMARNIIKRHQSPEEIGVMPPLGTRLFLNMQTARKIGLNISPGAMDMANEVIDR